MLFAFLTIYVNSLTVKINQIEFNGDTFDDILQQYQSGVNTIVSIIVQEGDFPVNSLSNEYSQLTTIEVPANCFTGSISDNLFQNMDVLKTVIIEGAISIGQSSFQNCTQLETIHFSSCIHVNSKSFQSCSLLKSVSMPLLQKIDSYAFSGTSLTSIEFNYLTQIGDYSFSDCSLLTEITTPLIESIGSYSFKGASFTTLTFANLLEMGTNGHCFESCTKLEIINLNKIEELPPYSFNGCTSLHTIIGENVTTIKEYCFYSCIKLATITFPILETIENYAFQGITTISEVNYQNVIYIGESAYESCTGLKTVVLDSCKTIREKAFKGCTSLSRIEIPELYAIYHSAFYNTIIETAEFPKLESMWVSTVDGTKNYAGYFSYCKHLKSFTTPLANIIPTQMFYSCSALSTLNMDRVESIGSNALYGCSDLNYLRLPKVKSIGSEQFTGYSNFIHLELNGVESVGSYAFQNCNNLETVVMHSCVSIYRYGFSGCKKLYSIDFPNLVSIDAVAFANTALVTVELNNLTSATYISPSGNTRGDHFYGCASLVNITMKKLSYIQYQMFMSCSMLTYIDAPLVNKIGYAAFSGCNLYSNITFPVLSSVLSESFAKCSGITSINLPSLTTVSSEAFAYCKNLKSVSLKNCTFIDVQAFYYCSSLKDIYLPNLTELANRAFAYTALTNIELNSLTRVTTTKYSSIGTTGNHFQGCNLLVNVTMKKLSYIQYCMFLSCSQLSYVDAPLVKSIEYQSFYGCNSYNNITFPLINSINSEAFYGDSGITEINFPSLTTIGEYAFAYCKNLKLFSSENCTYINDNAFYYSSSLEKIYLPNLRELEARAFAFTALIDVELNSLTTAYTYTSSGTIYSNHFQGCTSLYKVSMKSLTGIQRRMFYSCTNLTEIDIPSALSIGLEGFYGCSSLTIAKLDSCSSMSSDCFSGCVNIKTISIGYQTISFGLIPYPKTLTHVSFPRALTVPDNAFYNFNEMISCKLPIVSTVGSSSFEGCTKLVDLEIPLVIELNGDRTFYNCENLGSLSLRSLVTVNSSCPDLFQGCRGLQYISLPDRPPKTFNRDTFQGLSCKVYIPSESLTVYDDDESIDGDKKGDLKWCGIELSKHEFIKIIGDDKEGIGVTLTEACSSAGLILSEIKSLRILTGYLSQDVLNSFKDNFDNLNELIFDSNVSIENEKIPIKFLFNHKKIQNVCFYCSVRIIEESAFEECSQLISVSSDAKELKSRCFYGPTKIETISFAFVDTLTGSNFFSNNPFLQNIELPKLEFASVTGYISENSPQLKSISLPETPPTFLSGNFLLDVSPNLVGVSNDALIKYDSADEVDNDMKYYSINLTYTLIVCLIDGESKGGLNLKSIVNNDAKIVEVISGNIKESDLILPKTIVSFIMREETTLESIPPNAFSNYINLQTINIYSTNSFTINEEAFSGCISIESVQINGAISIQGLTFKGCNQLKTIVLNNVETIIGNFHFDGCHQLVSISLQSLKTVSKESSMIFLGCLQLTTLKLPSTPPKTFNKDVFIGLENKITLALPKESDYTIYDDDISIDGDKMQDGLWCGLMLPSAIIYIKLNKRNNIIKGLKLFECIQASGIPESSITTLEITRGIVQISLLLETIKKLFFLENLVISKSVVFRGEFTKGLFSGLNLISISLPFIKTVPEEFFKDCIKLKDVTLDDATKLCTSAFKGCISIESISLDIDTLEGDSIFEGCKSLTTAVLRKLVTVDSTAENIFSGCPLMSISLPSTPPKTFNKNTFIRMNVMLNGLTNNELRIYDSNIEVKDDIKDDLKWCGIDLIQLYITVSINEQQPINCSTLTDATQLKSVSEIKSIEIIQGMVKKTHFEELKSFTDLLRLTISENAILESSIIDSKQFENMKSLIHVKIMQNVSLMSYCFNNCSSLLSIEFKEVLLLSEGSFNNCSSLNTINIPHCKELRGDFIFSGCSSLREIDLSHLLTVDSSAFRIFEGCNQLTIIKLPSVEPLVFHKDTFINCPGVTLKLPNNDDYVVYDDESHVVDDIKEDEKWCGIKIDSAFLPPFLTYKINDVEYKNRKLIYVQNPEDSVYLLENENETDDNTFEVKTLELLGGLVDSIELKEMMKKSPLIEKFEAHIGTLTEILSETFSSSINLKEIIIHTEIYISYGALQNIPNLEVLKMDLQQSIRNDDLLGDNNLREIVFPLLTTIPSNTFANLPKLISIQLDTASIIHKECFMNCLSIEKLELPNIRIIDGDSHFEGCINLKFIDLSSLSTVHQTASRIFMNCNKLSTLKLGMEPPKIFNNDVFNNAGILPYISIPSEIGWRNYIPQCTINKDNNHYIWYGFDTGLIKEETQEYSCPLFSQIELPTPSETSIYHPNSITMTFEMTITYVLRKSVSYSNGLTISKYLFGTYISGEYVMVESQTYVYSYLPYIIQFYSMTKSPFQKIYEVFNLKKKLTPEMLIGITCGSTAVFFIILTCLILYCRQLQKSRLDEFIDFLISEEDMENDTNNKNKDNNENKPTVKIIQDSGNEDDIENGLDYWF